VFDNIYIERFWRTLKYQYIYLNPACGGLELYLDIQQWLTKYYYRRRQGIDLQKPIDKYKSAALNEIKKIQVLV